MSDDFNLDPRRVVIERAHRLGNGNNPRPIIAKFLSYKDKPAIQIRIREKINDDELAWENPHRVSEDFTQGVRDQRKGLAPYMKNARAAGKRAYLSYNKLVMHQSFVASAPSGPRNSGAFNFSIFKALLKALHCQAKFVVKSPLKAPAPRG